MGMCDQQMNQMMRMDGHHDGDASVSGQQRALMTMKKYVDNALFYLQCVCFN